MPLKATGVTVAFALALGAATGATAEAPRLIEGQLRKHKIAFELL